MKLVRRFLTLLKVPSRPLSTSLGLHAEATATSDAKPFSDMPGLKGLPLVGCAPMFLRDIKNKTARYDTFMFKLHSELGPTYRLKMPGPGNSWYVVTSSPEAAETAFRSEGKHPSRGYFEDNTMWIFKKLDSPPPMFFSKGEVWKKTRSAAAKQVVPRRVSNFVEPLSIIAEELLAHLESIWDESGNVQDISGELLKWGFQGVSYFVYGEKIDIYSGTDLLMKEFMEAGLQYIESIGLIVQALPLYRIYPTKVYRDYVKVVRRMQRAGKQLLDRRYEEIKDAIASGTVDEDRAVGLLDQWLIEKKFTEEEALSQSYDMLSAGIDTTSNTAIFLLYEIAKQPELQERLVQEISSVVGDKEHPSWEDLQKMTLVRNCVKETMRMYVPTNGTSRILEEDVLLSGYQVPSGTPVLMSIHAMGANEQIFENPQQFKPERWNKDQSASIHRFSSLPFGFGPRSCYGRRLAELELYLLLVKMLPKYHLTTNLKDADLKLEQMIVVRPSVPVPVNFRLRI